MPCDTLEEFKTLATYRKSFNPDLQTAKSRPVKLLVYEGFKFEKDQKNLLLVVGAIGAELAKQLKENAGKLKAEGTVAFVDDVVKVALKSGNFTDAELKKALEWAAVKRAGKVGDEPAADEDAAPPPLPPRTAAVSKAFLEAKAELETFMKERVAALVWHENEIQTQQQAEAKIVEVQAAITAFEQKITAANVKAKQLGNELKELKKDEKVAKYQKGQITKLEKQIEEQSTLVDALQKKIETQKRGLPQLQLLAQKHGSSRHGAQTDLGLQARRAATGGISPDQSDNVHGVSEKRVDDPEGAATSATEVRWRKTRIRYVEEADGKRKVVNATDVLKALLTDIKDMDAVSTSTASKFLSHELEKEAVDRALALVKDHCPWKEIEENGQWQPLNSVTVYLDTPRRAAGWGYALQRAPDTGKKALNAANLTLERFRNGTIDQAEMLKQLDVSFASATERLEDGSTSTSVPLVKSARVTVGRTSGGAWTSITHFPDPAATPPGWSIRGKFVRASAKDPRQTVPGRTA
jgi:hypothetical protein